jgi:hypothetical protein
VVSMPVSLARLAQGPTAYKLAKHVRQHGQSPFDEYNITKVDQ